MTQDLRIGLIGAGGIARSVHVPGYRAQEGVEIVAVCDIVPGKAQEFADTYHVAHAYNSCAEMLAREDLDAVSVCTPNHAHKETTLAALEKGLDVLCEKPIAMNLDEGLEMVQAAKQAGRVLQIGLNWRFSSEAQTLKRFIEAGDLGDIYYGEATYLRRRGIPSWGVFTQKACQGGGALIDIGVHTLDHTMWLMGNPRPTSVMGVTYANFGKRPGMVSPSAPWDTEKFDVDDMGIALVRFENGASLILRASWAAHIEGNVRGTRILGTEGGAFMSPLKIYQDVHGAMIDITPSGLPDVESHTEEIRHFVACLRGECACSVIPQQVLYTQAVLDAIYRSAESGHEVLLDTMCIDQI